MKKLLLAGIAGLLSITGAYAAPILSNPTITNGGLQFSNFSCGSSGTGISSGSCAGLNVDAFGSGVRFSGSLLLAGSAGGAGGSNDLLIGYSIAATPDPVSAITLTFNGQVAGPTFAFAEVTESVFSSLGGTLLATTGVTTVTNTLQNTITLDPARSSLYVVKDVGLFARAGEPFTSATISFIDQGYTTTPPTSVPEPASLALLGAGMFGLGLVRRAKRS